VAEVKGKRYERYKWLKKVCIALLQSELLQLSTQHIHLFVTAMAIAIPSRLSCIATTNRSRPRVVSCYAGKQAGAAALGAAVLLLTAVRH
jgi:hypothetical protein